MSRNYNNMLPEGVAAYATLVATAVIGGTNPGNSFYCQNTPKEEVVETVETEENIDKEETTIVDEIQYDDETLNAIDLNSNENYSTDYSDFDYIAVRDAYEQILLEENPLTDKEIIESFNDEMKYWGYGVSIKSYSEDQHLLVLESNKTNSNGIKKVQIDNSLWFDRFNELLNTLKVKKLFVSENVLLDCSELDTSNLDEIFLGDFDKDTLDWIEYDKPMLEKLTLYCSSDRKIVVDLYSRSIKNIQIIGKDNEYQYDPNITLGEIDVGYETDEEKEENVTSVSFYNVKTNCYDTEIRKLDVDNVKFVDVDLTHANSYDIEELEDIPFSIENKSSSVRYNPEKDDFDAVVRRTGHITYKTHDYSSLSNFLIESFNQQFKSYGVELEYQSSDERHRLYVNDITSSASKIKNAEFYKEFNKLIKCLQIDSLTFRGNSKRFDFPQIEVENIDMMGIRIDNPDDDVYKWISYCKPRLSYLSLIYDDSESHKINLYSSSICILAIRNDSEETDNVELGNIYYTYYNEKGNHSYGGLEIDNIPIKKETQVNYIDDKKTTFIYTYNDIYFNDVKDFKNFVSERKTNSKVLTK